MNYHVNLIERNLHSRMRPIEASFDEVVEQLNQQIEEYLVLITVSNATTDREITNHEKIESEYESRRRRDLDLEGL